MLSKVYDAQMKFFCIDNIGTIKELAFLKWNNKVGIISAEEEENRYFKSSVCNLGEK